ncbi:XRE family transcriptional regulator [Mucilaginibacter sp. HMF5004]|uniref:XRE family transcriptional regulator n=1 Tax=Mucilaginibacter rivuli TaxID=2857527 RepID=UPI001C5EEAB5|nr:XRE family transcriptional regulator [Mucilaginibacter rivuli]MBW4888789.1 XRE family transcriptional regulator [Mucilaginibacter rivuli]
MKFNPQMLKLARELRGYTQTQLSELMGVAQGTISKIEKFGSGFDESLAQLAAKILNLPVSFFDNQDTIIPIQGEFRRKLSTSVKQLNQNNAKMTIAERQLLKLLDGIEISANEIPVWNVDIEGSPSLCAQHIRRIWKIPRGRIDNLTTIVENKGAIIIPLSLQDMDGFSMYTTNGIPLIFINKDISADRARLTIAHELAHIILHLSCNVDSSRDRESEAFEFAAELLMPEADIRTQLVRLNLMTLADLKKYWKTSMQSIIRRSKNLGMLNENQYKYLSIQMSAEGYRTKEPIFFPHEQPSVLKQIIDAYIDDLDYSIAEIAELLDSSIDEFRENYLQNKISSMRKV